MIGKVTSIILHPLLLAIHHSNAAGFSPLLRIITLESGRVVKRVLLSSLLLGKTNSRFQNLCIRRPIYSICTIVWDNIREMVRRAGLHRQPLTKFILSTEQTYVSLI